MNTKHQDILTDIIDELNSLRKSAVTRRNAKDINLIETINNRVIYLWGKLDEEKD